MSFIPMPFSEADIPASPRLLDGHFRDTAARGPQCLGLGRFLAGTNAPASENSVAHRRSLAQAAPDDAIPQAALVGFVRLAPPEFNREPVGVLQPLKKSFYPHRIEAFELRDDAKLHEKTSYRGAVCTTERGTRAGG
jgi:hypothetical protein